MGNLIAVDAGGTSTRAVVLTRSGDCVGYGVAGSGNPISSGTEHAAAEIVRAVGTALENTDAPRTGASTVLAMAGARTHIATEWITSALVKIGLDGPLELESDLLATFCSGAWELDGYAVVAGTGAAAIRVHDARDVAASDGLGWLLGDDGSGFWIGQRTVRAVAAQLDSRGPATRLTPLLLEMLGIPADTSLERGSDGRPDALRLLLDVVYRMRPIELAQFAPLVFAAEGDATATDIADQARASLRATLAAIATDDVRGPVVCGGGVLGTLGLPVDGVAGVTDVRAVPDGTVGAAVLALRANGVEVDAAMFERVTDSLATLRR